MTSDLSVSTPFAYHAVRTDGTVERGVVQAASRENALTALRERGLLPMTVRAALHRPQRRKRVPPAELALGLRILADLLDSGLPMSRALATFEELAPPSWQAGLATIRGTVREGRSFASALLASELELPPLVIGVIQAGEAGSGLAAAIRRAAEFTETSAETRSAIRGALAYPIVLAGAGLSAVALLVGVVLPRFAVILADLGQDVPPSTRMLLTLSNVAAIGAIPTVIGLTLLIAAWRFWIATPSGQQRWHELLLGIPVLGNIRHAAGTAHASAALASLLDSGVALPVALSHTARATGDGAIGQRLLAARERVLSGERVGVAIGTTKALTTTGIRLIRAGEDTGRLAPMLHHTAKLESARAQQLVKSGVRLLEPLLILTFGALIAFVAAALLQAVYSVRPT